MNTPGAADRAASCVLYGDGCRSINRRAVIAGGVATAMLAGRLTAAERVVPDPARVAALRWDGRAHVTMGDTILDLSVQTRVEPFGRTVSRSWITRQGSWSARTMTIDATGGWVERDGKRTALPPAQAAHERQQYALYSFMLAALAGRPLAGHGIAPPILTLSADGLLRSGSYRVRTPDGAGYLDQTLTFEEIAERSTFWPARMLMKSADMTFDLSFDVFGLDAR